MKTLKPFIITLSCIFVLLVVIALITPPIAKNYIVKHSKELIGRQINMQGLYLNLFTGYARISGFELLEQDDQHTFVAFDTLSVDMSIFRLLSKEIRVNHINLVNPDIKLLQNGLSFNFDDLLAIGQTDTIPQADSTARPAEQGMAIALYDIRISGGHILYKDLIRNSVWQMENFGLEIPGVYFSGQNTNIGIALNFNDGGHLQTTMQYNMEAGNYLLNVDLTNFSIAPIRPYLTDFVNISSIEGLLNTRLNIEGNATHVTDLSVRGDLNLDQLSLTDHLGKPVLSTDSIRIGMENINPAKSVFHFQTIAINGLKTAFDLEKNGTTLTRLLKNTPPDTTSAHQQPETTTTTTEAAPDLKINTFRINNSTFAFNDNTLHTPFTFNLENISIVADHLTLDQKNKAKISSTLKNGGSITFNYEGKIDDISNTDILVNIKNLDLQSFTPYSLEYFGYPLQKGIFSFSSINNIRQNIMDGRNNLNIAKCEVGNKRKDPKPEFSIPLKTALYLIKDKNELIKMDLPVHGNINSPEFSYRKIIFRTLTNLLVKVAVSPINFLASSLGFSPDQLKNLPFEATQNDFTPDQLTQINQIAEIIKAKPEMTLVMEQFINLPQSHAELAQFYVKRNFYLQQNPDKIQETLLPIDYSKITEINSRDIYFINYVNSQVSENMKSAYLEEQILSLADTVQIDLLTRQLIDKRNQSLVNYLIRQGVPEKCLQITTATENKLTAYKDKNLYTVNMVLKGDEPEE